MGNLAMDIGLRTCRRFVPFGIWFLRLFAVNQTRLDVAITRPLILQLLTLVNQAVNAAIRRSLISEERKSSVGIRAASLSELEL